MATNRKKVLIPHTMGQQGKDVLLARDDIDTVVYSANIKQAELLPMLADTSGIALSGTPYKQTEMEASRLMQVVARIGVGYDAVEVPALTARRVPLMTAGTANSTSVAEQAFHLIIALAKRNRALDSLVRDGKWLERHGGLPIELSGKTVLIVGFGRIGTRSARRCLAFDMSVQVYGHMSARSGHSCRGMREGNGFGCGTAAGRFRHRALSQDARDGGPVQRGAVRAHEAGAPASSTLPVGASSTRRRCMRR